MAGFYPDEWLEDLRSQSDIVQVISQYVPLKQKNRRFWGCCPFHSEKTPSFSVEPDKQFFYCFGCHKGGNVIQFIMDVEKLSFPEAVELLAERAGMELPQNTSARQNKDREQNKKRLYEALREAALFYHKQLNGPKGEKARAYLERRGISPQQQVRFGLGYAPEGWRTLSDHLTAKGFTLDELSHAGLAVVKNGKHYDFFRDKVMYPIIDPRGRVVAFGGRILEGNGPKYVNTPQTAVYNKSEMLYGLNFHRSFDSAREIYVVEGYMDMISVSSAGFTNVVASLGTALTTGQVRLIRRYADTVYIAYDGDAAGRNATLRGLELVENEGLTVRVLMLPDGLDPDDFIRKHGRAAFAALREKALTLTECKIEAIRQSCDMETENGRTEFAKKASQLIAQASPVEQERYLRLTAKLSGFAYETLLRQIGLDKRTAKQPAEEKPLRPPDTGLEQKTIGLMINDTEARQMFLKTMEVLDFGDEMTRRLFTLMSMSPEIKADALLQAAGEGAGEVVSWLIEDKHVGKDVIRSYMARLRVERINREIDTLLYDYGSANEGEKRSIAAQIQEKNELLRQVQRNGIGL